MTDLREQLLKAGLITEAQATRTEEGGPRTGRHRRNSRGRGHDTRRIERRDPSDVTPEGEADAAKLAEDSRVDIKTQRGGRRWYYVSRDGLVPYVELGNDVAEKLSRGDLALVESPAGEAWFVSREIAVRILGLDPAWIRAFSA
ncbi:MAG: DUF2058 family protein [Deltaproteobacteria bacterium]|nr:MAG: DUF2058 family protein [Deltaproteobacteria bacterium]